MTESPTRVSEPRQRLGRGLAALLGDAKPEARNSSGNSPDIKHVPIEFVRSNARNPRSFFDENELEELAVSIKKRGIIQPIVVRPVAGISDAYEIVAGERRWRAAQRAGQHSVPVICLQITDREALELSIVENVQRTDLNALEEAKGYSQLASDYGYSHSDIGLAVSKSRSHVANTMRLLALPQHSQDLLKAGAISAGHARALLSVDDPDVLADKIVEHGLTVRDVEKLNSSERSAERVKKASVADPATQELVRRISLALGVETEIGNKKKGYSVTLKCKNPEQLEYVCSKLLT